MGTVKSRRRTRVRATLIAELKGMLERRAAPHADRIRAAFEVLVGAARVADSVYRSEARIAAHEAKRQKMIQADTEGEMIAARSVPPRAMQ